MLVLYRILWCYIVWILFSDSTQKVQKSDCIQWNEIPPKAHEKIGQNFYTSFPNISSPIFFGLTMDLDNLCVLPL